MSLELSVPWTRRRGETASGLGPAEIHGERKPDSPIRGSVKRAKAVKILPEVSTRNKNGSCGPLLFWVMTNHF